jgi:hypothetical protein
MPTYSSLLDEQGATQSVPVGVLRDVASFFHDNESELFNKLEVTDRLVEQLDIKPAMARRAVDNLALDSVDPVVQVPTESGPHVGVIEYEESDYYYTYTDHDDVLGKRIRSVCATCVNEELALENVHHYTRAESEYSEEEAQLLLAAHHYVDHQEMSVADITEKVGINGAVVPSEITVNSIAQIIDLEKVDIDVPVNTGASLLSNSTVGGNIVITSANGSDLNVETLSTNGNAGTAPVSNGDGTLSMVTVDATQEQTLAQTLINL